MKTAVTRIALALLSLGFFTSTANAAFVAKPATPPTETKAAPAANEESVTANAATEHWNSISRSERHDRLHSAKQAFKDWKNAADSDTNKLLLVLIAILLPPLAVLIYEKRANTKFLLSILLWLLFYIPGLIYALLVIFGNA